MRMVKPELISVGCTHMNITKMGYTPPSAQREEKEVVVEKDVDVNVYTHEQALEFMGITESEFLGLLIETGNCPSGILDEKRIYPRELISEIDPKKWFDPKAYSLEELYGDVVHNTYTLEEALKILEISKSEFKKRSVEQEFCMVEEFEVTKEFPFEWVWYIDNCY